MAAKIIDGKLVSQKIVADLKAQVNGFDKKPTLAVIQVGNDPASSTYVNIKIKRCAEIGIKSLSYKFDENFSEDDLLQLISKLNSNPDVNGILVQVPLPKHINEKKVLNFISPDKDVDGFHPNNVGKLISGDCQLVSCTPLGIMSLIDHYKIELEGKHAVVVGRSNTVGKPVAMLLLQRNSTVTVCHSKTSDLKEFTKQADILVVAVGRPSLITGDMVKKGAVVIDVGTNRVGKKLTGDVDFDSVKEKASYISPVPGGVGPMTVASLMGNTIKAYKNQVKNNDS